MPGFTVFSVMSADPARPAGAKGVPGGTAAAVPAAVLQGVQQRAKPACSSVQACLLCCAGGAFMRSLRHTALPAPS